MKTQNQKQRPTFAGRCFVLALLRLPASLERPRPPRRRIAISHGFQAMRARGCRLIFVALPWQGAPYPLAPDLAARVRVLGADWVDMHQAPGLKPNYFADAIHLTPQGRVWLLPQLEQQLRPLLSKRRRRG